MRYIPSLRLLHFHVWRNLCLETKNHVSIRETCPEPYTQPPVSGIKKVRIFARLTATRAYDTIWN